MSNKNKRRAKPKKRVNPVDKTITFGLKEFEQLKRDLQEEASNKTAMLYLAALAEDGYNEDKIIELFETIIRYAEYLDEHIVQIRNVQDIIENRTGIKINWKW